MAVYAELLAIRSKTERARVAGTLLGLDGRNDLSPEEEALAEVLTLLIIRLPGEDLPFAPSVSERVPKSAYRRTRAET